MYDTQLPESAKAFVRKCTPMSANKKEDQGSAGVRLSFASNRVVKPLTELGTSSSTPVNANRRRQTTHRICVHLRINALGQ
ncbi:hypothetical protein [Salinisphaera sp. RV14]|uniref:hypothetical protein n=1 Tax=Salinisphaera sp. RV14 TaxID=3454140 RepID=UPI003F864237